VTRVETGDDVAGRDNRGARSSGHASSRGDRVERRRVLPASAGAVSRVRANIAVALPNAKHALPRPRTMGRVTGLRPPMMPSLPADSQPPGH
jgi:hypothetical protein